MTRECYKEILKLKAMLDNEKIPYELEKGYFNGYGLAYPSKKSIICSVIEHDHSYGRGEDLIEIMGLLTKSKSENDNVIGY